MASSTEELQHHQPLTPYAATTAAPPPTPSTHNHTTTTTTTAAATEALSSLLHRLPSINLSAPPRRSSSAAPMIISLSDTNLRQNLLSAATSTGFFHLVHRPSASASAESSADAVLSLHPDRRRTLFPNKFPVGYDEEDEAFCVDSSCFNVTDFNFDSLREFMFDMESVGMKLIEELAKAAGFENLPCREKMNTLMWISDDWATETGRVYPYVVGLHYPVKESYVRFDSGSIRVEPKSEESVLVTLGDIAQVWSNGKFKKVRGRPLPSLGEDINDSGCTTMSVLITLPLEATVSPLIPNLAINDVEEQENEEKERSIGTKTEKRMFRSFPFEDYARRVYDERLLLKDPLIKYRV